MYLGKTYFSFKYGTYSTRQLVTDAVDNGVTTLAITNINSTCDAWDFVQYCREAGIKPILGVEIRNDNQLLYILIAANNAGFRSINEFLSRYLLEKKKFPLPGECGPIFGQPAGGQAADGKPTSGRLADRKPADRHFADGKPASGRLADGKPIFDQPSDGYILYPLGSRDPAQLLENERIAILPEEAPKLFRQPLAAYPDKWVIRQPVVVQNQVYYNLHRLLRAIDRNTLLSKLSAEDLASPLERFTPLADILTAFRQYPGLITNTYRLFDNCGISMDFGADKNKKVYSASREDDKVLLEKLAREGLKNRYGPGARNALLRLEKELAIIHQMDFTAYFLITWDMIRYAQSRGFYHVGRGSGANSIVAYCLRITDVDPLELDLYFERFLNPHRKSPPDFDIDFSYLERDEVIDYMMKRYGRAHVTLLGMYATFQYNAIVRELGKVFGLPKSEIDALAEGRYQFRQAPQPPAQPPVHTGADNRIHAAADNPPHAAAGNPSHATTDNRVHPLAHTGADNWAHAAAGSPSHAATDNRAQPLAHTGAGNPPHAATDNPSRRSNRRPPEPDTDKIARAIQQYGGLLQNFPSTLSIHPGGILISEEPLYNYCAMHMPPKGFATALLDMFVAENIGLHKLDVLSQRGLGHIKECVQLVKANRHIDIDIHMVERFKKDSAVRQQLRVGNTIGCFYIESPAMRQLIRKLHCDNYETLVAASSIIRPGVGRSGMMGQYIWRHHNPGKFEYPHPKLKEILGTTYGVMIYQEQVIQVAHEWAGLDMADADMLRRATSPKYRGKGLLPVLKEKFFSSCAALGYVSTVVEEIWRQIESFADYSFCKAHSASYAVESYQSLYLKTYFPMEFAVAVINNFGGFYNRELYFYELMKTGAVVHRPCVNTGEYFTSIRGVDVTVGFVHAKGVEVALVQSILSARSAGAFTSLADFIERVAIGSEQLELLIRIDALRFTGKSKKQLLWEGDFLLKKTKTHGQAWQPLFREAPVSFTLPILPGYPMDDFYDDIELLGFPVGDVFDLVDEDPSRFLSARDLPSQLGQVVTVLGYHVTHKPVRTVKGEMMSFGTFLDANKEWVDTVHFPQVHAQNPPRSGFYKITGRVTEEFGVFAIEVHYAEKAGIRQRMEVAS